MEGILYTLWDGSMQNKKVLELCLKSIEWNERKLPANTLEMQLKKVDEEFEELFAAKEPEAKTQELADVFISMAGICRFCIWKGFAGVAGLLSGFEKYGISIEEILQAAEKKLTTIENLNYVIVDGVYRHIAIN